MTDIPLGTPGAPNVMARRRRLEWKRPSVLPGFGITFGYKDEGHERVMYAYDMDRVRTELSALQKRGN